MTDETPDQPGERPSFPADDPMDERRPRGRRHHVGVLIALLAMLCVGAALMIPTERQTCAGLCRRSGPAAGAPSPAALARLPGRLVDGATPQASFVPPDDARALNAAAPFWRGPVAAARPFRFSGSDEDRQRAVTCLAAAQLYEAGLSERDQMAVAQVVLNRVRHPAYPHTICAVVFEGAERATGCQFTFTCDGALTRRYSDAAWEAARALAGRMLDGDVDKRVGWATHYHTDWVYPYWSPSLDKLSAVNTHLFFKWRGYWGTAAAFSARYAGKEAPVRLLAAIGQAPEPAEVEVVLAETDGEGQAPPRPQPDLPLPAGVAPGALDGNALKLVHPDGGGYGLLIRHGATGDELLATALRLCFGENFCRVMGWDSASDIPRGFPVPPASIASLRFSYVRDPQAPRAQARFDCARFPRTKKDQCL